MIYYIKADTFYFAHESRKGGYLAVEDGLFGQWQSDLPVGAKVVDYTGYQIAPGLVDTHIHGYAGCDVMDNSLEGMKTMSQALLSAGVTSFLPTTLTASFQQLREVSAMLKRAKNQVTGAKIQGIYFEGPYFTEKFKGAQNTAYMRDPSLEEFNQWQEASGGLIKKIALAPERKGAADFVSALTAQGVTVALGHSNATFEEAKSAVKAGASVWVHAYNGMRGFNHREPGMVGAVFAISDTIAELIADGHHVSPVAAAILLKQKSSQQIALITDCMAAGGQPDGHYMLGDYPVVVENGTARLKDGGNLAGSVLKLKDGLKNLVIWQIAAVEEAICMASYIPAKSVGLEDKCGQIKAGLPADFIVLDDKLNLQATYLDGEKAWTC
ncbi:N-acetylglucosamine-6-phosphate deacetylase [Streptococcus dentiloxodontae]